MSQRLSLNALQIFEAAGRSLSFKVAAETLFLTPSAVSQAIRKLEEEVGFKLFLRRNTSVLLTEQGESLYQEVTHAFGMIRSRIDLLSQGAGETITVYSSPSFASQVIRPALKLLGPSEVIGDIRIMTADVPDLKLYQQFDISILYGRAGSLLSDTRPIGEDIFTPLCSPELAAQIQSIDDLLGQTFIIVDNHQVTWKDWFEANGHVFRQPRLIRVTHAYDAIGAALAGLGVILESRRLVRDELAHQRLVAPVWTATKALSEPLHSLYISPSKANHRGVASLVRAIEALSLPFASVIDLE